MASTQAQSQSQSASTPTRSTAAFSPPAHVHLLWDVDSIDGTNAVEAVTQREHGQGQRDRHHPPPSPRLIGLHLQHLAQQYGTLTTSIAVCSCSSLTQSHSSSLSPSYTHPSADSTSSAPPIHPSTPQEATSSSDHSISSHDTHADDGGEHQHDRTTDEHKHTQLLHELHECGMEVESNDGWSSSESAILSALLRLVMDVHQWHQQRIGIQRQGIGGLSSPSSTRRRLLLIITNRQSLAGKLTRMRQTGVYDAILLLDGEKAEKEKQDEQQRKDVTAKSSSALRQSVTSARSFDAFIRAMENGRNEKSVDESSTAAPSRTFTFSPLPLHRTSDSTSSATSLSSESDSSRSLPATPTRSAFGVGIGLDVTSSSPVSSPVAESDAANPTAATGTMSSASSLLGLPSSMSHPLALNYVPSPQSAQALLPTPPSAGSQHEQQALAHSPGLRYLTHSSVSVSVSPRAPMSSTPPKGRRMPASAPASPSHMPYSAGTSSSRVFFPSSSTAASASGSTTSTPLSSHLAPPHMSAFHGQTSPQQLSRAGSGSTIPPPGRQTQAQMQMQTQTQGAMSHLAHEGGGSRMSAAARTRICVAAFQRIIQYCQQEKIIPRESVLKKRLVDNKAELGMNIGTGGSNLDFEEFLHIVTQVAGVGVVEGEPPQRIIWPRGSDGSARHFPCADFFVPVQRLSPQQNDELLEFLYRVQPEVDRGRFGFATYLARHGPPFIQLLPHGVLVELVQLLLNQKVLLFRKGKVSVASKSEAWAAKQIGQFFNATDFHTPATSRASSPTPMQQQASLALQHSKLALSASPPIDLSGMKSSMEESHRWEEKPTATLNADAPVWQPQASTFESSRLTNTAGLSAFSGPSYGRTGMGSFSMPSSRVPSPIPSRTPPISTAPSKDAMMAAPYAAKSVGTTQQLPSAGFEQPLAVHRTGFDALSQSNDDMYFTGMGGVGWDKEEAEDWLGKSTPDKGIGLDAGLGIGRASPRSDTAATVWESTMAPFDHSTGFIGESVDACDPAAVLAAKLAELNAPYIGSSIHSPDELARFTSAIQFRPCFHFEKSGAAHTPEWICVVSFCVGAQRYEFRSDQHSKKDSSRSQVSLTVLQQIEDGKLEHNTQAKVDPARASADPVTDLARLLNFLQQAPAVYILNRNQQPPHNRFGRRGSTGSMGMGSQLHGVGEWQGSVRIQVKSVNVITGEAQPTVSASTPFSHNATGHTRAEVKEKLAASLLQQIERARIVNPALFSVLNAARMARPTLPPRISRTRPPSPEAMWRTHMPPTGSSAPSAVASTSTFPSFSDSNTRGVASSSAAPPPVDMSRLGSSLFSLHTPVPGRPFSGVHHIGLRTPLESPSQDPTHAAEGQGGATVGSGSGSGSGSSRPEALRRSISEVINEESEILSKASAERALEDEQDNDQ